jgi:hypothetical protein
MEKMYRKVVHPLLANSIGPHFYNGGNQNVFDSLMAIIGRLKSRSHKVHGHGLTPNVVDEVRCIRKHVHIEERI